MITTEATMTSEEDEPAPEQYSNQKGPEIEPNKKSPL